MSESAQYLVETNLCLLVSEGQNELVPAASKPVVVSAAKNKRLTDWSSQALKTNVTDYVGPILQPTPKAANKAAFLRDILILYVSINV
jgi:hypothetical protein